MTRFSVNSGNLAACVEVVLNGLVRSKSTLTLGRVDELLTAIAKPGGNKKDREARAEELFRCACLAAQRSALCAGYGGAMHPAFGSFAEPVIAMSAAGCLPWCLFAEAFVHMVGEGIC
jgi:hypothetical protein